MSEVTLPTTETLSTGKRVTIRPLTLPTYSKLKRKAVGLVGERLASLMGMAGDITKGEKLEATDMEKMAPFLSDALSQSSDVIDELTEDLIAACAHEYEGPLTLLEMLELRGLIVEYIDLPKIIATEGNFVASLLRQYPVAGQLMDRLTSSSNSETVTKSSNAS